MIEQLTKQRQMDWLGRGFSGLLYFALAAWSWNQTGWGPHAGTLAAVIVAGFLIGVFYQMKQHQAPWYMILLGMNKQLVSPRDEREFTILQKASMYTTVGDVLLLFTLLIVLLLTAAPSKISLVFLFEGFLFLHWGLVSFFAWRFGWKE